MADGNAGSLIAALELLVERYGPGGYPDYPLVTILIDGRDTLARHGRRGYKGFSPAQILGARSPLLAGDSPRRVAVYGCCCGLTRCGCVAPLICQHDNEVTWTDFRDFTGVYDGPGTQARPEGGVPLPFPDLVFDAGQYRAEIEQATADQSWQTADWQAARLLWQFLEQQRSQLGRLSWVPDGIRSDYRPGQFDVWLTDTGRQQQIRVRLTARDGTPADRARLMADALVHTQPGHWPVAQRHSLTAADSDT